jgi:cold shock CspA family protein
MFVESKIWNGYRSDDPDAHAALMEHIESTGYTSPRRAAKPRKSPEYQPISAGKVIGRVTFYSERGFGKIEGGVFFHISGFVDNNASFVQVGAAVAYDMGFGRDGKPKAVEIQLVEAIENNQHIKKGK